jgi:hypothetical protein
MTGRATSLVRAADGILGTHRTWTGHGVLAHNLVKIGATDHLTGPATKDQQVLPNQSPHALTPVAGFRSK